MSEFKPQERILSLDAFRGLTIAAMILVNNPGTWSSIYGPLRHAEWHGITPTDYIFPFFLFIVGVAIPVAFTKRLAESPKRELYRKILFRSAAIFASGWAISAIPFFVIGETTIPWPLKWLAVLSIVAALFFLYIRKFKIVAALVAVWAVIVFGFYFSGWEVTPYNVAGMRIFGVLQRIAICYLFASIIFLNFGWKAQVVITAVLLLGYWALMTLIPVPGCDIATINDKACNLAAWLDRTILTEAHIWRGGKVYDPEGILSSVPAIATTLIGVLTGSKLIANGEAADDESQTPMQRAARMFFWGTILLALGWSWSLVFPLNKSLWTSSYAVYTGGLALLTLGVCYYLIDVLRYKRWAKPFIVFGVNALALFVFSGIMARMFGIIKIGELSLQQWIYQTLFLTWLSPINASLAYALTFVLFWFVLMWLLYRRRIFIKI